MLDYFKPKKQREEIKHQKTMERQAYNESYRSAKLQALRKQAGIDARRKVEKKGSSLEGLSKGISVLVGDPNDWGLGNASSKKSKKSHHSDLFDIGL